MKVLFGVTSPISASSFLIGQMDYLRREGHDVGLMCPPDDEVERLCAGEGAMFWPVAIHRRPHPAKELSAVRDIVRAIRAAQPDVVILGTPKMSLLGLFAAAFVRVPRRIYLVHGLRHEGASAVGGKALRAIESLNMSLATDVVAVSRSVGSKLGELPRHRLKSISVLGHGSPNGVSLHQYSPASAQTRQSAHSSLGIKEDRVALFVGRLTSDKGIEELLKLAEQLRDNERLLVAGPAEPSSKDDELIIDALGHHQRVIALGHVRDTSALYAAADVLVLPTRREGLPTVVLEAGASGIPTVAYSVTGCIDAVRPGVTGELVRFRDQELFIDLALNLLRSPERSAQMGSQARQHMESHFDQILVWRNWSKFLDSRSRHRL